MLILAILVLYLGFEMDCEHRTHERLVCEVDLSDTQLDDLEGLGFTGVLEEEVVKRRLAVLGGRFAGARSVGALGLSGPILILLRGELILRCLINRLRQRARCAGGLGQLVPRHLWAGLSHLRLAAAFLLAQLVAECHKAQGGHHAEEDAEDSGGVHRHVHPTSSVE